MSRYQTELYKSIVKAEKVNLKKFSSTTGRKIRTFQKFREIEIWTRGAATPQSFPSSVWNGSKMKWLQNEMAPKWNGSKMKWLQNEMVENFKKNIDSLRCEDSRSLHNKYNIRQKLALSVFISLCSEEHFRYFFRENVKLSVFGTLSQKIFGRVDKTAFYVSRRNLMKNLLMEL